MDSDRRAVELAAHQAAEWLDRLQHPSREDTAAFLQWLRTSALNVRELLLAATLDTELRAIDCHRSVDVQALLARTENVVAAAARSSVQWPPRPNGRAGTRGTD